MPYYLLLCRSITHAQRMNKLLERSGVTAPYYRAPAGLTNRGCSYAVRIGADHYPAALRILQSGRPCACFIPQVMGLTAR